MLPHLNPPCHAGGFDFIRGRLAHRLAALLEISQPGGCVDRLLQRHSHLAAGLLMGAAELLEQAAGGLDPDPAMPAAGIAVRASHLQDQTGWQAQLKDACWVLFSPRLAAAWPSGRTVDGWALRRHLSKGLPQLCQLLLSPHIRERLSADICAPLTGSSAAAGGGRASSSSMAAPEGEPLLVAVLATLASLAEQLTGGAGWRNATAPDGRLVELPVFYTCRSLDLVWMLARGAACLVAASWPPGPPGSGEERGGALQLLGRCLRSAADLLASLMDRASATGQCSISLQDSGRSGCAYTALLWSAYRKPAAAVEEAPAPARARVAAAAAGPVALAVEAVACLAGRFYQAGGTQLPAGEAALDCLPLGCKAVQLLASTAAAAPPAEACAAWLPQLQLLRTAGKLCRQAAADISAAAGVPHRRSPALALVDRAAALLEAAAVAALGSLSCPVLATAEAEGRGDGWAATVMLPQPGFSNSSLPGPSALPAPKPQTLPSLQAPAAGRCVGQPGCLQGADRRSRGACPAYLGPEVPSPAHGSTWAECRPNPRLCGGGDAHLALHARCLGPAAAGSGPAGPAAGRQRSQGLGGSLDGPRPGSRRAGVQFCLCHWGLCAAQPQASWG